MQTKLRTTDWWVRVIGLGVIAFTAMLGYSLARPATKSLFLEELGRDFEPFVWCVTAFVVVVTVALWNRAAANLDLARIMAWVGFMSSGCLAGLLIAYEYSSPDSTVRAIATFALYVWRDVYIVVLVETFYSFANAVFPLKTARWAYGMFGALGSVGGFLGNMSVGGLADKIGTARVPWLVIPTLVLICGVAYYLSNRAGEPPRKGDKSLSPGLLEGFRVVKSSRYLVWVLALIAFTQLATNVLDYLFSGVLESHFEDQELRTAAIGHVYAAIDVATLVMNVAAGAVLLWLGVGRVLLIIPVLLAVSVFGALLVPGFMAVAIAKVANKSMDYSLFRVSKEAVYLPLNSMEKTSGKAVIDILTYRVAKGVASMLLLVLVAMDAQSLAIYLVLVLVSVWIWITIRLVREYRMVVTD
jgi:ATP:ADP antiporter, AAA family